MMRFSILLFLTILSGCASQQKNSPPPETLPVKPLERNLDHKELRIPNKLEVPSNFTLLPPVIPPIRAPSQVNTTSEWTGKIKTWLPNVAVDKDGWSQDIFQAFYTQKINLSKENVCAAIAIINQESSFQVEPKIPGLSQIVKKELEARREKYHVPEWILEKALNNTSPNGKTYSQRIKALRTESDINHLFDDMTNELPLGKQLLKDYNPVHTGGPMQVSLKFSEESVKETPYPFAIKRSLRDELFSRRGGVYFGVAHLLNYPANYDMMKYRFADFNSGRYASRNAAFQTLVSKITHQRLDLDGDLLAYKDGKPEESDLEKMVLRIRGPLQMTAQEISSDLTLEKSKDFEGTGLYKNIYRLARMKNISVPYAIIPSIKLHSPKIKRKLTTAWFTERVGEHYQSCLAM
jgi:hypothetical protein